MQLQQTISPNLAPSTLIFPNPSLTLRRPP